MDVFPGVSHASSNGAGPNRSQYFGAPTHATFCKLTSAHLRQVKISFYRVHHSHNAMLRRASESQVMSVTPPRMVIHRAGLNSREAPCQTALIVSFIGFKMFENTSLTQLGFPANCITNTSYFLQLKMYQ